MSVVLWHMQLTILCASFPIFFLTVWLRHWNIIQSLVEACLLYELGRDLCNHLISL